MHQPESYSFQRYLAAKQTVDDRALNPNVFEALRQALLCHPAERMQVLEAGAGTGAMLKRLMAAGMLPAANYTAIDSDPLNLSAAHESLSAWATEHEASFHQASDGRIQIQGYGLDVALMLEAIDLFDFLVRPGELGRWDLVVAHAFLDLLDLPTALLQLLRLLKPGGLFYFTINFDGVTILEPQIDPYLDPLIERLYHRTMDERQVNGSPSGDSQSGRHLFTHLRNAGADLLAAGASDWVIYPVSGGYPVDEAYFLHHIIHTIGAALTGHPQLDPTAFTAWLDKRHAQVERGELIYIAHQLDFAGWVGEE